MIVGREGKASSGSVPWYTPMVPTQVREPFHRDGWVYEEKVDGWRILAYKDGDRVRFLELRGRRGVPGAHPSPSARFSESTFSGGRP